MRAGRMLPVAIRKELRAVAPAFLVSVGLFGALWLTAPRGAGSGAIAVTLLGAAALGALSMGHEYSGGTLSLLLSQPRRRPDIVFLKLGTLAPVLLALVALGFVCSGGSANGRTTAAGVSLLCGFFVAPWLTMLCRSALAGIVFTAAIPGMLLLAGQIAAALKFGTGPEAATASSALETAVVLWGMVAVSGVAAVCGWRLFMRLEAIDGRGDEVRLPWPRETPAAVAGPRLAKQSALWLVLMKELRLQQLSFVTAGLFLFGWVVVWAAKGAMPYVYTSLLFVLSGLNAFAVALLAGSLASAEERHLGTLEWHALLPTRAWSQWAVKVAVVLTVALVVGVSLPIVLASATGSRAIHDAVRGPLSLDAGYAVLFVAVGSLYVSSLSATPLQAMLWSAVTGVGLLVFASTWFLWALIRIEAWPWSARPFFDLQEWRYYLVEPRAGLLTWLIAKTAIAFVMHAGVVGLLLHFARANHGSAERSPRRVSRQLISLVAFLGVLQVLSYGVTSTFRVQAAAYGRDLMKRAYGFLTVAAIDSEGKPQERYTAVVIPEEPSRNRGISRIEPPRFSNSPRDRILLPGRYLAIAVEPLGRDALQDPATVGRLKARATPFTIAAGESKTIQLTLSSY